MIDRILDELGGRGVSVLLGLLVGSTVTWVFARWKRFRERRSIHRGDARDTVVINLHLVESATGPGGRVATALRIRSIGQGALARVVPNGHLAAELRRRATHATARDTLISMEGPEGSYLLETLTNFVCDRAANGSFDHDLYVMAPCCEPAALALHQPITILLICQADLALFESWPTCRDVRVEHGSDGARVLTLMEMAKRFRAEQERIAALRAAGRRTLHEETMYVLDLAVDRRTADVPVKPVPWGRFEGVLKGLGLE